MIKNIIMALIGTFVFWLMIIITSIIYKEFGELVLVVITISIGVFSILLTIQSCKDK